MRQVVRAGLDGATYSVEADAGQVYQHKMRFTALLVFDPDISGHWSLLPARTKLPSGRYGLVGAG